jgi:hypothetical protein
MSPIKVMVRADEFWSQRETHMASPDMSVQVPEIQVTNAAQSKMEHLLIGKHD